MKVELAKKTYKVLRRCIARIMCANGMVSVYIIKKYGHIHTEYGSGFKIIKIEFVRFKFLKSVKMNYFLYMQVYYFLIF